MNVSHEVGAIWRIQDQATPTLRLIAEALGKFDAIAKGVEERLGRIGTFKFTGLIEEFGKVGGAAEGAQAKIGAMADTRFAGLNRSLTGVAERLERIQGHAKSAGDAMNGMRALPGSGGGGGAHVRPGSNNTGGHGGRAHREGAGVDMGIFGFIGAEVVGHGTADILKHGMELQHVQEQMIAGGMQAKDVAEATGKAWEQASKYGLNVSKVMDDIKELRFPFGSTEHAIQFIDPLEKMRVVLNSVSEGRGNSTADSVYQMARAGELKGLQNPQDFLTYFDDMTKVISATGGKVSPNDYMQAMKYGRVASLGWDEEFTTKYLPTLMQSLGPSGAGTAAMSLYGTLAQGKVGKRALGQMEDIGLIGDMSKIIYDGKGDPVGFNPGAVKGTDEFVKNPALWAQNTLLPLLTSKFGDITSDAGRLHAAEGLGGLFGNRMSAQAISEFILRMQSINKDADLTRGAQGIAGANRLLQNDPTAAMNNLQAAWTNLLTAFGASAVQPAIDAMNLIAGGINKLTEVANEHPEIMKALVGALAGLAVGLGALAVVGLAVFLPGGLFAVAMTTMAGAIGGIIAVEWDKIASVFMMMKGFFTGFADAITGCWDKIKGVASAIAHPFGQGAPEGMGGAVGPMAYIPGAANDNLNPMAQAVKDGFLAAFQQIQGGGGAGGGIGGGSGFSNAAYTTFGSGGGGPLSGGNFAGSTGDGSAVDRALGMRGAREGDAARALGHIMHAGEWCADFTNAIIEKAGGHGSGSATARSFMGWGHAVALSQVAKGDVAVLNGGGHVGLFTGEHGPGGSLGVIAGNTRDGHGGHEVRHYFVSPGSVYGARRGMPDVVPRGISPGKPASQAPATTASNDHAPFVINLGGDTLYKGVAKRLTAALRKPTSVGGPNHRMYPVSPGTPVTDVA